MYVIKGESYLKSITKQWFYKRYDILTGVMTDH